MLEIADSIIVSQNDSRAAELFIDEIEQKFRSYSHQPGMGTLREDLGEGLRCFTVRKQYVVIYRPIDDGISVLRIFHGARDYPRLFHER
ncbi:MAG: type II toxin-antitoxin system RelE/ParE family toxin [Planctomycetes bacterium]|nr:type II toxin-antitoxin system RelE/ParE family toxin [Planctomycetota bacterium]